MSRRSWSKPKFVLASLCVAGAVAAGSVTSASGRTAHAAAKLTTINIGLALSPPKVIFLAPYVAQQQGYFRMFGLKANFISMPNGLQTELGTTAGSIDFGFSSATDSIEAAAQRSPIHAIWSYGTKLDTECIGAPGIHSAKNLIGKPVGSTGTDGFSITLLQACLQPAGVSLRQVKPINMTRSEFVPAMTAGQIDAAVFHADDAYVIKHQLKGASVLAQEYKSRPNWWYGGVAAKDAYVKAHKTVVVNFLKAMMLADRWMNNPKNNAALVKLGVKETGETPAAVAYAVKFNRDSGTWPDGVGLPRGAVNYTAGVLYKYKDIDRKPSFSQIVDPTYAKQAAAELGKSS
ncbi:MAG TPA: ABC transporter substrate-binding protein [Solirubrobacteraceae bacterium]|nr:ABC transporter substrate-binding protein [Solirubrobacteraceae bacterium]